MDGITVYGPPTNEKVGITLFNVKGISSEEVTECLSREYGIAVRGGYHCAPLAHQAIGTFDGGAVRLSVGPFHTRREIRAAVEAIYQIRKTRKI
jgi:selenocysteine lyase/cysteine desulfurase